MIEKRIRIPGVTVLLTILSTFSANAQPAPNSQVRTPAQTQTQPAFRAGQQIVINVDAQYYLGTVERASRRDNCTYIEYRWKSGNRSGSGSTSPDCINGSIFSVEEAKRRRLDIVNASPSVSTSLSAPVQPPPTATAGRPATPPRAAGAGAQVSQAQIEELLRAHNRWRAEVGAPNLTWSSTVAASAQGWANQLAPGQLKHDQRTEYGENLYWGSGVRTPTAAVDSWGSEKQKCGYRGEAINNQNFKCVGHYTQMVWRNSRELGCGIARGSDGSSTWVCRYKPGGNVVGAKPY